MWRVDDSIRAGGKRYVGHTVYHTEFMSVILKAGDFYAGQRRVVQCEVYRGNKSKVGGNQGGLEAKRRSFCGEPKSFTAETPKIPRHQSTCVGLH